MKKHILVIIYLICSLYSYTTESINITRGLAVFEKMNQHDGIQIKLIDDKKQLIKKTETLNSGEYYFYDLENGKYKINIDFQDFHKEIEFKKDTKVQNISQVIIPINRDLYSNYLLIMIIIILVICMNFITIYFFVIGKKIKGRAQIILSISFMDFWFVGELFRFFIGLRYEYIAGKLWTISQIGLGFAAIFLYSFVLEYPKKINKIFPKIFLVGMLVGNFIIMILLNIWGYFDLNIKFRKYFDYEGQNIYLISKILILVVLLYALYILILGYIKNENKGKKIEYFTILRAVFFVVLMVGGLVISFSIFSWRKPFRGYFVLIFGIIDTILYGSILKYNFEFIYKKKYEQYFKIFIEMYKLSLILIILFAVMNIFNFHQKFHFIGFTALIIVVKCILDILLEKIKEEQRIKYNKVIKKLQTSRGIIDFKKTLQFELGKLIDIKEIKLISKNNINYQKIFYNSKEDILGNEEFIEKYSELSEYDLGIRIRIEKDILAIIFINFLDKKKKIEEKEIEFLKSFSKDLAFSLNNILINEAKNKIIEKQLIDDIREEYNNKIQYIRKITKLIEENSEQDLVLDYCKMINKKMEEDDIYE